MLPCGKGGLSRVVTLHRIAPSHSPLAGWDRSGSGVEIEPLSVKWSLANREPPLDAADVGTTAFCGHLNMWAAARPNSCNAPAIVVSTAGGRCQQRC